MRICVSLRSRFCWWKIVYILIIAYRLFGMNSFKSSPLIQSTIKPKFNRKSRRVSKKRPSKDHEVLVANPFKQG